MSLRCFCILLAGAGLLAGPARGAARAAPGAGASCSESPPSAADAARLYPWARKRDGYESLACRIAAPAGFTRVPAPEGSYGYWLRHLPLRAPATPVRSFRGELILAADSPHLAAVVDLDVGKRDRQQCADTIMRLRGEYLHCRGRADGASFRWAGGRYFGFAEWRQGIRPVRDGRRWKMERTARPAGGYASFRRYLSYMFAWTGTVHQVSEPRVSRAKLRIGDFFIQAGSPGHAVVVLDLARDDAGRLIGLVGQGFMPAQDLHVLRSPGGPRWFPLDESVDEVRTPLWRPFQWRDLRRFRH